MFDPIQKSAGSPERPYVGLRMLAVAGAGVLVSLGLCGVGFALTKFGQAQLGAVNMIGFGLFCLSVLLLVVSVLVLIIELIVRR